MDAGVALTTLDRLRPTLERRGLSLTDSSHMRMYIPLVEKKEFELVVKEMGGNPWSFAVDGTRRIGEAIAGVVRWCSRDWKLHHRLTMFTTTERNVTGRELSALVVHNALKDLSKPIDSLVLFERDACSVNYACFNILTTAFYATDDFLCCCHLLSLVGGALEFETLNEFMTSWLVLVQNSPAAKSLWLGSSGQAMVGYSPIRWHSKAMIEMQIGVNFSVVPGFLNELVADGIGDATTKNVGNLH